MSKVPRKPERIDFGRITLAQLAEAFFRFSEDVIDFARSVPTFLVREVTVRRNDMPISLDTRGVSDVVAVIGSTARQTTDRGAYIPIGSVSWRPSEGGEDAGITIESIDGLPSNTDCDVRLLIVGRRA